MYMNIKRALERIGYHPNEILVYLAILKAGELTVAGIAQNTKISRSSVQIILEHLHARGILGRLVKRGQTIWVSENPERLVSDLEVKGELVRAMLPQLKALRNRKIEPPTTRQFTGRASIETLLNEVIISHYPVSFIGSLPAMFYFIGQTITRDFFEMLFQQEVSVKIISERSPEIELIQNNMIPAKHTIHYCNDDRYAQTIYILFNDRVAVILLNETELMGTLYTDVGVSQSFGLLFETLWEKSAS